MVPVGGSAPTMLGIMWMFQIIAFGLVSLRLYARLNVVQKYGWDDHFFNTAVVSPPSTHPAIFKNPQTHPRDSPALKTDPACC